MHPHATLSKVLETTNGFGVDWRHNVEVESEQLTHPYSLEPLRFACFEGLRVQHAIC